MLAVPAEGEHLIHLQPPRNLMRNKDHRHLPLELVDRLGKVFCRLLVEVGDRFIEGQDLRPLDKARAMAILCRCPPESPVPRSPITV